MNKFYEIVDRFNKDIRVLEEKIKVSKPISGESDKDYDLGFLPDLILTAVIEDGVYKLQKHLNYKENFPGFEHIGQSVFVRGSNGEISVKTIDGKILIYQISVKKVK